MAASEIEAADLGDSLQPGEPNFRQLYRAKLSCAIAIRKPEGRAPTRRLLARSGLAGENIRPGVMERRHLSVDERRGLRPNLSGLSLYRSRKTRRQGFGLVAAEQARLEVAEGLPGWGSTTPEVSMPSWPVSRLPVGVRSVGATSKRRAGPVPCALLSRPEGRRSSPNPWTPWAKRQL